MVVTSLVTGGAGFIGSHVVNHLLLLGHKVVVLDDLSGGFRENVNTEAILEVGCITDTALINGLFAEYKFTYVYHLAAYAAEGLSHFIRKFNYTNNLIGSINLINAAVNHDVKCFVFTSSIAVYGINDSIPTEIQQPKPEDPYGIAKYAVELDLLNAHKMFGLNYVIFRPHNVYGPNQNIADKYRNVVGIFMNQILSGKPLPVFGNGQQSRSFSYIDDVAPYIANSVNVRKASNQVINIGSDNVHTVRNLATAVCEAMKVTPNLLELEERQETTHAHADHSKFKRIFNPKEHTNLKQGLSIMVEWVKDHGSRTSKEFENIEIKKNLPPFWRQ